MPKTQPKKTKNNHSPQKTGYHGNQNAAVPNPRNKKISIRLTLDEHARVAAAAAAHKLPTAEHARNILLQF